MKVLEKIGASSLESVSSVETAYEGIQTRYKNSALFISQQGFFVLHCYWVLASKSSAIIFICCYLTFYVCFNDVPFPG